MKKEEIYFIRRVGINLLDEEEIVTTDSVDNFPDISTFLEVMNNVAEEDWDIIRPQLKRAIYTSCMMHYTIEVFRKKLISQKVYENVMHKAEKILKSIKSDKVIALTLLYEGPYYLHPELYAVYEKAGYSKTVKAYMDIFGPIINKVEKEKDFSVTYGKEYKAYMDLYQNFVRLGEKI